MLLNNIDNFTRGWIVGEFSPAILQSNIEVGIHSYTEGTIHERHYHKNCSEINICTDGVCNFHFISNDIYHTIEMIKGDILVIEPYEVSQFEAVSDCSLTVIKTNSDKHDKYIVE